MSADTTVPVGGDSGGGAYLPSSFAAVPTIVMVAGSLDDVDATPADLSSIDFDGRVFERGGSRGTIIRGCLEYPTGSLTAVTDELQVILVGRVKGGAEGTDWHILRNEAGAIDVEFTIDLTNDLEFAEGNPPVEMARTTASRADHAWDCDGFDEFAFIVAQALSTDANDALARLSVWII